MPVEPRVDAGSLVENEIRYASLPAQRVGIRDQGYCHFQPSGKSLLRLGSSASLFARNHTILFLFLSSVQATGKSNSSGARYQPQPGSDADLTGVGARLNRGRRPIPVESDADPDWVHFDLGYIKGTRDQKGSKAIKAIRGQRERKEIQVRRG
uniref:Uncharacterized protein n=1 Tax=Candidatus Kentrum sp. MB TaxID=2138164 RepID=A0A450XW93_9GAMM|nr:MAG: hypothetical protein BECKMB1821G_GA0114241_11653 [Candidatus Kentron sp. MB]VFK33560.1 MAG: hypothetical protein BECKMB1821I_GA0114274_10487 [Candidatus Kentron sp. MB]